VKKAGPFRSCFRKFTFETKKTHTRNHPESTVKSLLEALVIASLWLVTTSAGYAQHDAKDGKDILVQQQPKPVSQDEWSFSFAPSFWLPSVLLDISVPTVTVGNRTIGGDFSVDVPWWETLSKFSDNLYVLTPGGRFEAWKGRWGGFIDGYWIFGRATSDNSDSRLVLRDRVDITTSSSVTTHFDFGQVNFGPQFKLGTVPLGATSSVSSVLYGGGRVNWIGVDVDGSLTIRASGNLGEIGRTINFSSDNGRAVVEPMIGFKTSWTLGKKVQAILRGDVGGFGVVTANNWDCDLEAGIAWEAWRNTYLDLAYRARGQWQDDGSNAKVIISGWFHGPELGLTFKF
jgi:hypothetical protein